MKNMKKTLALVLTFVVILTCFVACKKEDEEKVKPHKNFAGEAVAVVTEKDGGIIRDDVGNVVVYVTEKDGVIVKNEDGEPETKHQAIEHAIVTGRRIEMADYAINIPDGWSDSKSYDDLHIKRNGTEDQISITVSRDKKLADIEAANSKIIDFFPGDAKTNKTIKVAGEEANFVSAYTTTTVKDEETGKDKTVGVYLCFVTFSHQGAVYSCRIDSDRDLSGDINNIVAILDTIEFVH